MTPPISFQNPQRLTESQRGVAACNCALFVPRGSVVPTSGMDPLLPYPPSEVLGEAVELPVWSFRRSPFTENVLGIFNVSSFQIYLPVLNTTSIAAFSI